MSSPLLEQEVQARTAELRRLNRVHAVLSGVSSQIVRVRDRDELFKEICRIATESGAFKIAWVAVPEPKALQLKLAASKGGAPASFARLPLGLDASDHERHGPAGQAFLGKKPVVEQDKKRAMLPLVVSDTAVAVGVLALTANEAGFFAGEPMKLLGELADNVAFAIDRIDRQEKLDYLAYYDALTGLANHRLFLERLGQHVLSAAKDGRKLAIYLLDLERFKNITDSLGRPAGDALLRQVAQWLTGIAGGAHLVARVRADNFVVVLPQAADSATVRRVLQQTLKAFQEHPFQLEGAEFRIAAKAGVAVYPDDGADAGTLFKNAEAALKKAKAGGDRYLFYTRTMTATVAGKLTLENRLRRALDNSEFVLHYQPKVSLASGKLTGAEALIRWNGPHAGLVSSDRFVPVLEEIGMIHDVGRWALRQAIADYLRWRAAGLPALRVAVNVSPMQLRSEGFIAEIEQALGVHADAPAGLELEITESLIMEDIQHSIASLKAIRAMGVTIAIDDFGTGFSSLSYLARLPVDTLKIDRSFVVDMTAGPQGLALVSAVISLAHALKLNVVAEGVETEEQAQLLRSLACGEMQGFLFSAAVPGDMFEAKFLAPASRKKGAHVHA